METPVPNTLVIGGPRSLKGKTGFDVVMPDYTNLLGANTRRRLNDYERVIFWPTTGTFDFATSLREWQKARQARPNLPEFTKEAWQQLHQPLPPNEVLWDEAQQRGSRLWDELTKRCHELLYPVRDAVISGTLVAVVVVDPDLVHDGPASERLLGWFSRHIVLRFSRSPVQLTEAVLEHPVARAFGSLRSEIENWPLVFDVARWPAQGEHPDSLMGDHWWLDHMVENETCDDELDRIHEQIEYQGALADTVNVIAALSDTEGGARALLFLARKGGVIVVPPPKDAAAFAAAVCALGGAEPVVPTRDPPEFFRGVKDAAAYAKCHPETMSSWIKRAWIKCDGYAEGKRIGPGIRIPRTEIDAMIRKRTSSKA